jgi:hypothetical protein
MYSNNELPPLLVIIHDQILVQKARIALATLLSSLFDSAVLIVQERSQPKVTCAANCANGAMPFYEA